MGRQNFSISLWWAAVFPTLRTTGLERERGYDGRQYALKRNNDIHEVKKEIEREKNT